MASAVNLVGDWALSAKLVDGDDIDDSRDRGVLLPLNGPGVVLALVGVDCPPLYSSAPGDDERCMF